MVTVYHMRRYLVFLDSLFANAGVDSVEVSSPVAEFAGEIAGVLGRSLAGEDALVDDQARFEMVAALGKAGEKHRAAVYGGKFGVRKALSVAAIRELLLLALSAIDGTICANRRADGLYHSYNLLKIAGETASLGHLTEMLEGQVALLGSTFLSSAEAVEVLKALRGSKLYREDQNSYILYPDRQIAPLLSRNQLPATACQEAPVLAEFIAGGERSVVVADERGFLHFQADLTNAADLSGRLDRLTAEERWGEAVRRDRQAILDLWETVFHHSEFTGRSGTMFCFEGLGCIYWHMIAKLLLAVQESHHAALSTDPAAAEALAGAYDDVRSGLGFTKSPGVYSAFPTDPYSHTPRHRGAQQPGMTGQVKEEILTRLGELGVEVTGARLRFAPRLLKVGEFFTEEHEFAYVDAAGRDALWKLPAGSLGFTYCQVPVCYTLADAPSIRLERDGAEPQLIPGNELSRGESLAVFGRTGEITKITVILSRTLLRSSQS